MRLAQLVRHPAAPYAGPFLAFVALLAVMPRLAFEPRFALVVWLVVPAAAIVALSRPVLEFSPARPAASIAVGVAVFLVWIAPDTLLPEWRGHWLFQNPLTGTLKSSFDSAALADPLVLTLRSLRAILLVPILEELFWRGWLLRWFIDPDFTKLRLGAYQPSAFWIVAALFALEHGPYWEVGLAAGAIYNWWLTRTGRLSDLILAHAVTNACLCAFVIATGRWQYWL